MTNQSAAVSTAVEIVEVSPRDGLQSGEFSFSAKEKAELIRRCTQTGIRRIEAVSFVHPARVPAMADAEEVLALCAQSSGIVHIGLVLNVRGAQRALESTVDEIGAVCAATDAFAMRNQGIGRQACLEEMIKILAMARRAKRRAQVTIAVAFGCPFEGRVAQSEVVDMAKRLAEGQPREIALADTIGVAVPSEVETLVGAVTEAIAPIPVRLHFHNTRGLGPANVWAAIGAGARIIDASLGGLGGCPFAPGATGNVATEDVVYLLERSGIATGLDLPATIAASRWLSEHVGAPLPGMVSKAGAFVGGIAA